MVRRPSAIVDRGEKKTTPLVRLDPTPTCGPTRGPTPLINVPLISESVYQYISMEGPAAVTDDGKHTLATDEPVSVVKEPFLGKHTRSSKRSFG